VTLIPTPGQTIGPFFGYALPYAGDSALVPPGHPDAVQLHGRVLDGDDQPVPDALIELWQAAPDGDVPSGAGSLRRDGFTFTGWGRASTDDTGHYSFSTLTPGAPFFALTVFARGLLNRLFTRAYVPEHSDDPFLATVDAERRGTLVAQRDAHGFLFDIRLQGDGETVFLTFPRHLPRH
jgi:protocatechuate 3,4-dioxygenase, alpha subunit